MLYCEKGLALFKLNILNFQHVINPTKFRNDCPMGVVGDLIP